MRVERSRGSFAFLPPDRLPELLSRQNFLSASGDVPEHRELRRGQLGRLRPYEDAITVSINYQISQPELSHN